MKTKNELETSIPEDPKTPKYNELIFVKFSHTNHNLIEIRVNDILFIKACGDYMIIQTTIRSYTELSTMKETITELPKNFIRVHKSFIINMNKIDQIENNYLIIFNKKEELKIPVGPNYKNKNKHNVMNHIKKYLGIIK